MAKGCNRLSLKVKQRAGQRKKKDRLKRKAEQVRESRKKK